MGLRFDSLDDFGQAEECWDVWPKRTAGMNTLIQYILRLVVKVGPSKKPSVKASMTELVPGFDQTFSFVNLRSVQLSSLAGKLCQLGEQTLRRPLGKRAAGVAALNDKHLGSD